MKVNKLSEFISEIIKDRQSCQKIMVDYDEWMLHGYIGDCELRNVASKWLLSIDDLENGYVVATMRDIALAVFRHYARPQLTQPTFVGTCRGCIWEPTGEQTMNNKMLEFDVRGKHYTIDTDAADAHTFNVFCDGVLVQPNHTASGIMNYLIHIINNMDYTLNKLGSCNPR